MGFSDKAKTAAEEVAGKAKEAAGKVTGDKSLEGDGKLDQAKAKAKGAVEDIKDSFQ